MRCHESPHYSNSCLLDTCKFTRLNTTRKTAPRATLCHTAQGMAQSLGTMSKTGKIAAKKRKGLKDKSISRSLNLPNLARNSNSPIRIPKFSILRFFVLFYGQLFGHSAVEVSSLDFSAFARCSAKKDWSIERHSVSRTPRVISHL